MKHRTLVRGILIVFALASCGDDDPRGLSPEDELGDLPEDDVTELCDELLETAQEEVDTEAACTLFALLGAALQGKVITQKDCREQVTQCVLVGGLLGGEACVSGLEGIESCEATVEDLRECSDYAFELAGSLVEGLSCDDAGDPKAAAALADQFIDAFGIPPSGCRAMLSCGLDAFPIEGQGGAD